MTTTQLLIFLILIAAVLVMLGLLFWGASLRSIGSRASGGRTSGGDTISGSAEHRSHGNERGPAINTESALSDLIELGGAVDLPTAVRNDPPVALRSRSKLYHYTALVTDVYDGDTITVDIDLGLNMWVRNQRVRLWKINTPELKGSEREQGLAVRDWVRQRLLNKYVLLRTILDKRGQDKTGKYGRLLGEILVEDEDGEVTNINETLLAKGLAVPFGADGSAVDPNRGAVLPSAAPMPSQSPASGAPQREGAMVCPYCGETRRVDLENQIVLNCSNCMDEYYSISGKMDSTLQR